MLTVNVNFLYCSESVAVVARLMAYYKEDLDKKQKCSGLALILTWLKA